METIKQASACGFAFCISPYFEIFFLLLLFLVPTALQAAQQAPDAVLRGITSEVVATFKQDRDLPDDPVRLERLIETKVVPIFDFSMMTQLALGHGWRQTSSAQQARLTAEFRTLLLRTYSGMIATYRDPTVTYKPLRFVPGDTDATVRSEVTQKGAKPLRIDYEMTRTSEGWKVYDVKLDNVSLVTTYRGGFTAKIRDAGVDGLIRTLAEKNRQGAPLRTSLAGGQS
jgi:phospholipid transport system substrate-binding protein